MRYLLWNELNYLWSQLEVSWIEIVQEVEIIARGGSSEDYEKWVKDNPWEKLHNRIGEEKTKKFIKIFCTINNIEYEKIIKLNESVQVSVSQFEKVFNEAIRVKVDIKK